MSEEHPTKAVDAGAEGGVIISKKALKKRSATKQPTRRRPKAVGQEAAKRGGGPRSFPAETLEEALRVPSALKQFNAGNAWSPAEVANALGVAARGNKLWYLTASARDYGLTIGTRDTESIELAPIGRDLLYAALPEAEREAAWRDGDYMPVIEDLMARGFKFDVAFWDHANHEVKMACSKFVSLNQWLDHLALSR